MYTLIMMSYIILTPPVMSEVIHHRYPIFLNPLRCRTSNMHALLLKHQLAYLLQNFSLLAILLSNLRIFLPHSKAIRKKLEIPLCKRCKDKFFPLTSSNHGKTSLQISSQLRCWIFNVKLVGPLVFQLFNFMVLNKILGFYSSMSLQLKLGLNNLRGDLFTFHLTKGSITAPNWLKTQLNSIGPNSPVGFSWIES